MTDIHEEVQLVCPKCQHTKFSADDKWLNTVINDASDDEKFTCMECKTTYTKAEIMSANEARLLKAENHMYAKYLRELKRNSREEKKTIRIFLIKEIIGIIFWIAVVVFCIVGLFKSL